MVECWEPDNIDDDDWVRLTQGLRTNTTIKVLDIHKILVDGDKYTLLANVIKENQALEKLKLSLNPTIDNNSACCELILNAMESNQTVQHFRNYSQQIVTNPAIKEMQNKMLRRNTTLTDFVLFCPSLNEEDAHSRTTQFFLELNAAGRKRLLEEAGTGSINDWVDVLGNVRENLSHLYYFLRLNPSICRNYTPNVLGTCMATEAVTDRDNHCDDDETDRPTKRLCRRMNE